MGKLTASAGIIYSANNRLDKLTISADLAYNKLSILKALAGFNSTSLFQEDGMSWCRCGSFKAEDGGGSLDYTANDWFFCLWAVLLSNLRISSIVLSLFEV